MYLIFDTETTGFIKSKKNNDPNCFEHYPHIIQLAFILLDENFYEVKTYSELIKPNNWEIPVKQFWIENGYTTKENEKKGVEISDALKVFCDAVDQSNVLIAHNMKFDHPIISAEMKRHKVTPNRKPEHKICTMMQTINFCKIKKSNNSAGFKYPRLNELHFKLFNKGFEGAHDALEDVRATVRCFIELKKIKVF